VRGPGRRAWYLGSLASCCRWGASPINGASSASIRLTSLQHLSDLFDEAFAESDEIERLEALWNDLPIFNDDKGSQ